MFKRFSFALILILLIAVLIPTFGHLYKKKGIPEDFFFGVSIGADTAAEAIALIDKVKDYTNFLIVNSWEISTNQTALDQICWHAYNNGLSFIVFFDFISLEALIEIEHGFGYEWHHEWVSTAKERWGDQFLGIYIYEEPGGKQIDVGIFDEFYHRPEKEQLFENITTYHEAAEIFVNELPQGWSFHYLQNLNIDRFVSDYALYWFDYLAGYNTVFVELGFGHSTPTHIGLCRGAARSQGKDWGTIIVWNSRIIDPENSEERGVYKTGPEMYKDMIDSYVAGAKYVIVFNFPTHPPGNPYGILTEEHFSAMKKFWNYANTNPEDHGKTAGDIAYVLPKDYGWGMRRIDDNVWLPRWGPDWLSPIIWEELNTLVEKYGLRLNIIYDDPHFVIEGYNEIYYWSEVLN